MQSLTFITYIVSEKIATFKFLPYMDHQLQTISSPNTDHNIDSHFSCQSKTIRKKKKMYWKYSFKFRISDFLVSLKLCQGQQKLVHPMKIMIMQSLSGLANILVTCQSSSNLYQWKTFPSWSCQCINTQNLNLIGKEFTKKMLPVVYFKHLCDTEIRSRPLSLKWKCRHQEKVLS